MRGYYCCEYRYEVGEFHGAISLGGEEQDWVDYPASYSPSYTIL